MPGSKPRIGDEVHLVDHGLPRLKRKKSAMRDRELPVVELTMYFVAYKGLLLALAILSSYISLYDSSSNLLEQRSVLLHWDSVYFQHVASHGYVYEQEFAFGPLLPGLCRLVNPILLGCICHYISVVSLYRASMLYTDSERLAKVSAMLHILSPAGIFLCLGFTEPLFSALSLTALSLLHRQPLMAAAIFGLSGTARATGILSAILFLPRRPEPVRLLKSATYMAIVGLPWLGTQVYAYLLYCPGRPWCSRGLPMIYTFVQDHYWNVGFGRYFTLSNTPLFLIAAPMYTLCIVSLDFSLVSLQQGLLTLVTFTSAHAQIITRISSSFPRVYWYLASTMSHDGTARWSYIIMFFVLYGMIQAVLFGAFLPPA